MAVEKEDLRAEWYREWNLYYSAAGQIPLLPPIYWIGMISSAIWLVVYLVVYPSIPLVSAQTHWKGMGVPGGCQPWTAICEMQKSEDALSSRRGRYLKKLRETSVVELSSDLEMRDFISRAGRVPFEDRCAGCHGKRGAGIAAGPEIAPALNDKIWLHGGNVQAVKASIQSPAIHSFGLANSMDDSTAKILAIYIVDFGQGEAYANEMPRQAIAFRRGR